MEKNFFKKKILPFLSVALIAVIALAGCSGETPEGTPVGGVVSIGEGGTVFRFEKIDEELNLFEWDVHTNEATVGAALLEVGLIAGDVHDWGLMVTSVNGVTADFNDGGAWWRFNIDGEMSMYGVTATYIEAGRTYTFVFARG